ncbi:MAG: D-2-hydroxyacid dehydrogenase [Kiritimatiellae bacterium]|nr:D-2-hydroxyacid dehydrogenase [Kiritimatiellia bacterium]
MNVKTLVVFQENAIPYFAIKERHVARFRATYPDAAVVWCRDEASFLAVLPRADVAVTWEFRQAWFDHAPCLRRIATPAAGHDFFPITPPPSVQVRHGTFHGPIMAETLLGMMLAFNRGLYDAYRDQLAGGLWPRDQLYHLHLLVGSHAVILGFGHVGIACGRLLKAFGVRVTGVKRSPVPLPTGFGPEDRVVTMERLDEVLPEVDHLILVLPNDTGTDRLMDARRLALLPERTVIYNLGRGNCIDEAALADALEARRVRGACLDVFAKEPLTAASPLARNLPGLYRLPHASAFAEVYMDRFVDEVVAWLAE